LDLKHNYDLGKHNRRRYMIWKDWAELRIWKPWTGWERSSCRPFINCFCHSVTQPWTAFYVSLFEVIRGKGKVKWAPKDVPVQVKIYFFKI